ncbi:TraR/DksA family transcriptional regulator [Pseudoalteromonas sp. SG45-5]|uniref:TraR/DksA family transcriptional regulator n=1 Tax=unclassified Pseudoalteromonas TaxID=194690 RepID=UPI0015FA438D|nr:MULTISPECIES: TraR/DksA family transcriptional regulator [unclassified Pseudoalteromonas]MBB1386586.1 TraR/DksA family transcriptional regulator [Pseudoalteromonas sp. SG45-5]MBB1394624.1 TraR/DksA family transcriptional regulator [Pseudoalteromonas sp. SG44-4]MBB1447573.1 TraR/DksA family transcriptional regulator [Pseudoalteromonas sp. SG41-6]
MSKLDDAQKIEQHLLDAALSLHHEQANKPGAAFEHCQECGIEIPAARRKAVKNCSTCVECQSLIESLNEKQQHYRA